MDEARQCEVCGVLRLDSYCYFARYICGRCRQRAADEEQRAQEQSRLGIQVLSLACFDRLVTIYPEFWEPDVAVARWVSPDFVVADPPAFRPPPPLFVCPWSLFSVPVVSPHSSSSSSSSSLSALYAAVCERPPPRPSPATPPALRSARAIFFLAPAEAPWPPFETLWPPATVAETLRLRRLPYTETDLWDAVFAFYLENLASDELVDLDLDFIED